MDAKLLAQAVMGKLARDESMDLNSEHSKASVFIHALCEAIVEHLQTQAKVIVPSGSSAGVWGIT